MPHKRDFTGNPRFVVVFIGLSSILDLFQGVPLRGEVVVDLALVLPEPLVLLL